MEILKNDTDKKFIQNEELQRIQNMNTEFTKAKISLGDLEMNRQGILKHIDDLRLAFAEHEKTLIERYGVDSVINIQTGEITQKQK